MTERETLEKCRDMWKLLVGETNSGIGANNLKREAAKKVSPIYVPSHSCFCCEFVRLIFNISHDGGMACSGNISTTRSKNMLARCPLHELWPNGCEADDSTYQLWRDAMAFGKHDEASLHAIKIVLECERLLKFINEKTTESAEIPAA